MKSEEISVVIQGAIIPLMTNKCIQSVRKILPEAEIVLSTWVGENLDKLDYDVLVISKDPGYVYFDINNQNKFNINRMLISTINGLNKSSKKYVLKIRSDMLITGKGFINSFHEMQARDTNYKISQKKIVVNSLFSFKYQTFDNIYIHKSPFHISDWFYFGLREDIILLFNIPIPDMQSFGRYFDNKIKPQITCDQFLSRQWRFPPEQYITLNFIKNKFPSIKFDDYFDYEDINEEFSDRVIVNNFIIIDPGTAKIKCQKLPYKRWSNIYSLPEYIWNGLYRQQIYLIDYKKYCLPTYKIPYDKVRLIRNMYKLFNYNVRKVFCFFERMKTKYFLIASGNNTASINR